MESRSWSSRDEGDDDLHSLKMAAAATPPDGEITAYCRYIPGGFDTKVVVAFSLECARVNTAVRLEPALSETLGIGTIREGDGRGDNDRLLSGGVYDTDHNTISPNSRAVLIGKEAGRECPSNREEHARPGSAPIERPNKARRGDWHRKDSTRKRWKEPSGFPGGETKHRVPVTAIEVSEASAGDDP